MFPNDWRLYKLEQLSTKPISYGVVQTGELVEGGVACVRVVDLTSSELDPKMMITTNQEINQAYKKTILEKGELMIALRGEIGLVCLVDERVVGCNLTRGIARVSPKINLVDSAYLLWAMRAPMCRRDFISRANGSALQEISISELRKIIVPIPSLPEQKKIAEILGTWDEAIALTEKAITAKQKLKKSFSNKFFGIHCPKEKIGKLADVKTGGTPSRSEESYWLDGKIPWMSSGEINNRYVNKTKEFITDDGFKNSNATLLPKGSVMIALNGQGRTRGSVALLEIETTCNQSLAAIVPDSKILNNEFLFFYLESIYQEIRQLTGDEVRNGLNLKLIREIKVPIPDPVFQKEVASVMRLVDEEIDFLNRYAELINLQKQGLMQKLLTGKWRVTVESDA